MSSVVSNWLIDPAIEQQRLPNDRAAAQTAERIVQSGALKMREWKMQERQSMESHQKKYS